MEHRGQRPVPVGRRRLGEVHGHVDRELVLPRALGRHLRAQLPPQGLLGQELPGAGRALQRPDGLSLRKHRWGQRLHVLEHLPRLLQPPDRRRAVPARQPDGGGGQEHLHCRHRPPRAGGVLLPGRHRGHEERRQLPVVLHGHPLPEAVPHVLLDRRQGAGVGGCTCIAALFCALPTIWLMWVVGFQLREGGGVNRAPQTWGG